MKARIAYPYAALLACGIPTLATAEATLTLTPTSTHCVTIRSDRNGTTRTSVDCAPSPATPVEVVSGIGTFSSGQTFIELTYQYTYSDDGLALPGPVTLDTADYRTRNGLASSPPPSVSFESATLAVDVSSTFGPNPAGPGFLISASSSGAPAGATSLVDGYLVFGLNDTADSFSGSLTITVGVTAFNFNDMATVTGVAVSPSVAAIPEPSTYALMAIGLAAIGAGARSRRGSSAVDSSAAHAAATA